MRRIIFYIFNLDLECSWAQVRAKFCTSQIVSNKLKEFILLYPDLDENKDTCLNFIFCSHLHIVSGVWKLERKIAAGRNLFDQIVWYK